MSIKCSSFRCWALRISGETYAAQRSSNIGLVFWVLLDGPVEDVLNARVEDLEFPLVSSTTRCRGDSTRKPYSNDSLQISSFPSDSTPFLRTNTVVEGCKWWLSPFPSHKTNVFRVGIMADVVQWKIPVEDNIDWVADDPRTTPSKFEFEENFPEDLFTDIEDPGHANWEVRIPGAKQRICSAFKNGGFPVYQIIFEHMGLRLPFSDLEVAVFNHLELCPSQLHPNSLAFIRAFEIVAAYLQLAPTVPLFFHIFGIQRSRPRGNVTDKCWKTIIVRGPKLDDEGRVEHRDDGEPIEVDCERFPFCWSTKHYAREAKSFTFRKGALSKEELADLKALEDFVEEFPPSLWEDREGNPICDEEGYQLSSKKFINTKALLKCSTRTEAEDLLREMKNTQLTLRKLQAEKSY
ncbi:hypothetical protein TSUD_301150, partial [Trifolium subterraneum]